MSPLAIVLVAALQADPDAPTVVTSSSWAIASTRFATDGAGGGCAVWTQLCRPSSGHVASAILFSELRDGKWSAIETVHVGDEGSDLRIWGGREPVIAWVRGRTLWTATRGRGAWEVAASLDGQVGPLSASWDRRLQIARDAAGALHVAYLADGPQRPLHYARIRTPGREERVTLDRLCAFPDGACRFPTIACTDDAIHVACVHEEDTFEPLFRCRGDGKKFTELARVDTRTRYVFDPHLAGGGKELYGSWRDHTAASKSESWFSTTFARLTDDGKAPACEDFWPDAPPGAPFSLRVDGQGRAHTTWTGRHDAQNWVEDLLRKDGRWKVVATRAVPTPHADFAFQADGAVDVLWSEQRGKEWRVLHRRIK
jgi:hypothetical protein